MEGFSALFVTLSDEEEEEGEEEEEETEGGLHITMINQRATVQLKATEIS